MYKVQGVLCGWLLGWLAAVWFVGRLVGWTVDWLVGWLASLLALLGQIVLPDPNSFDSQFRWKTSVKLKLSMIFLEASPRGQL